MTVPKITNADEARELTNKYKNQLEEARLREQELILSKIAQKASKGAESYTIEEILQDISLDNIHLTYYREPSAISSFLKTKKFLVTFIPANDWDRYSSDSYKISW